ncbi:MAG: transcriptional regulator [Phenylobacterium sp.]|uniref:helix-turn-helix domain-containing protein n=1 Tax=Phenylobacterium sp. TaxID=1871053 RepID=UPI0025E1F7F4|nr:helix-turn-helix transcriptional regulator [Phenylobacterium sp.]MBA4010721.1 transcriptional regulator [Phenylobacterium sp.]
MAYDVPADFAPDPIDIHVGAEIRSRRKLANMSQEALAGRLGITFQQVQKYERASNRVSASMLARCAAALGCRPGDFFPADHQKPVENPSIAMAMAIVSQHKGSELLTDLARIAQTNPPAFASLVSLARVIAADVRNAG